jgi:arylsulfatase A-like enzyme
MDQLTLGLAMTGLRAMDLGRGPATDVLAISLSSTDAVGHRYGPDSRELHDQIVRLDRSLGAFLDSLYALRDSASVIVALTADHGMSSYPEIAHPVTGAGMHVSEDTLRSWIWQAARAAGLDTTATRVDDGTLLLDPAAFAAAGQQPQAFARRVTEHARGIPGVLRAELVSDLLHGDTLNDAITRRWVHMLPADLPYYAAITLREGYVWGRSRSAQHGSPYDDDSHVPILFYGAPFRPGKYPVFTRTVDIAPTLARVLGVEPTEPLDGHVLQQALR